MHADKIYRLARNHEKIQRTFEVTGLKKRRNERESDSGLYEYYRTPKEKRNKMSFYAAADGTPELMGERYRGMNYESI